MANSKLTDKTALAANTAKDDKLMIVDKSDTSSSSAGTSKRIDAQYIIQTDKISLNNSEVIALDDGGGSGEFKVLVAAPGSGYIVVPLQVTIIATGAGGTEGANKDLYIGYDVDQTSAYVYKHGRFCQGLASGSVKSFVGNNTNIGGNGSNGATIDNLALSVWSSGTFDGGWAMDIYITYQIVKIT
tara:strand:- start:194 stop:751 length:558 start_codon:yes stop_codon:yes gene_type:complete